MEWIGLVLVLLCVGTGLIFGMIKWRRTQRLLIRHQARLAEQDEQIRQYAQLKSRLTTLIAREGHLEAPPATDNELLIGIRRALNTIPKNGKLKDPSRLAAQPASETREQWLRKLEVCVRENIGDFQFGVNSLAGIMHLSRKELYRRVKAQTGLSVNAYIQEIRLVVAREKIESGEVSSMGELAHSVGLRSANYLSRLYRAQYNRTPTE